MVNPEKSRASAAGTGNVAFSWEHDVQSDAPGEERAGQEEWDRPPVVRQKSEYAAAGRRSESFRKKDGAWQRRLF